MASIKGSSSGDNLLGCSKEGGGMLQFLASRSPHQPPALVQAPWYPWQRSPSPRTHRSQFWGPRIATVSVLVLLYVVFMVGHRFAQAGGSGWIVLVPREAPVPIETTSSTTNSLQTGGEEEAKGEIVRAEDASDVNEVAMEHDEGSDASVVVWDNVPSFTLDRSQPTHVTVKYQNSGGYGAGLFNQHIAHEQAFMLAAALKANKLVWPPSRERSTFNSRSEHRTWKTVESSLIYDMDRISRYKMEVEAAPAKHYDHQFHAPRENTKARGYVALLDSEGEEIPGKSVLLGKKIRSGQHDLQDLAEHVNEKIEKLLERYGDDVDGVPEVSVVLEHTFYMIVSAPENIAVPVMSHLEFAPNLRKLARKAVKKLKQRTGSDTFNGLHLRVEEDASLFQKRIGGECGMLVLHNREMQKVGFNEDEPVFVASAIFSIEHASPNNLEKIITYSSDLMGAWGYKYASRILTKEMLLKPDSIAELGQEELAVVDWLILKESRRAVGWEASTFSISLRERRAIEGMPKYTMRLARFDWNAEQGSESMIPEECRDQQ